MVKRHMVEVGSSNVDRISHLPSEVIDHIFTCMSLRDTIRTSILSTGWRHKWVTTPHLIFHGQFELPLPGNKTPESVISGMLEKHRGTIHKISILGAKVENHDSVDTWLHFLLDHPVEDLGIELPVNYVTPNDLYQHRFDRLRHLNLVNVEIKLPPRFGGFSKLVNLNLTHCKIEYEDFKIFLSKCPVLECIDMYSYEQTSVWSLDISAPNLKSFTIWGLFSSIRFASARIEEIAVSYEIDSFHLFEIHDFIGTACKLTETFSQLPNIKKATIGPGFLKFLAMGGIVQKLPNNLDYLTVLELNEVNFRSMNGVASVLCLIRSSPNLQNLRVGAEEGAGEEDEEPIVQYLQAQRACNVHLNHLKTVDISPISGLETETEFVKLLLVWAAALEKMKIEAYFDELQMSKRDRMIEEVLNFDPASPNADILFP